MKESYELQKAKLVSSIHMGIDVEQHDPNIASIPPGKLSNEEIDWLAAWLLGEGVTLRNS